MTHAKLFVAALVSSIGLCVSCTSNPALSQSGGASQAGSVSSPSLEVAKVVSRKLAIVVRLPGELQPYEEVAVFPKVTGFVDAITVDRGSRAVAGGGGKRGGGQGGAEVGQRN